MLQMLKNNTYSNFFFDTRNIPSPPSRYQVSVAKTLSPPRHSFFFHDEGSYFINTFKKKVLII